jgi:protein SCO1/2
VPSGTRRLLAALIGSLTLGLLTACGATGSSAAVAPPAKGVGTRLDQPIPSALLHAPLVDSTGAVRHLSDFAGKVVVISDSMTLCQEACPIDTATLLQAARQTDQHPTAEKNVVFITLTVDPQRDTPAQLAAYRKQYAHGSSNVPNWMLLTGSAADVHAIWKFFGVYWQKVRQDEAVRNWRTGQPLTYDVAHSDEVFFLDQDQRERYILDGIPTAPSGTPIPQRIMKFLSAEGRKNLRKSGAWTANQAVDGIAWLLDTPL